MITRRLLLLTIAVGAQLANAVITVVNVTEACQASTFSQYLGANVTVEKVQVVPAGATYGEGALDLMYPIQPTDLPELCAVTIRVQSSTISAYRFGMFLPTTWNERYLALGNGGFGGGINWQDMGSSVKYGFAAVSTDTGHNSTTGDASWAYKNPQKRIDWGWRALNGSVTISKGLVNAYYAEKFKYSYYSGCSTGGRQGLRQVELQPDMFDGVIVGASAWYTTHLNPWFTKEGIYNLPPADPKAINPLLFTTMGDLVIEQCDALDGTVDGIISLPNLCFPDFNAMACAAAGVNQSACLTEAQLGTANMMYVDYYSESGEFLYPGLSPGCEGQVTAVWNQSITGTSLFGMGYLRYFIYDDPKYNYTMYNDTALDRAISTNPGQATVTSYDLSEFRDSGGKMIMYHGLADGLIPPRGSDWYYENVLDTMGGDFTELQEYFRHFQVPGLQHCWNSVVDLQLSPWAFGGEFQAPYLGTDAWSVPGFVDPQHDIVLAMMAWVENGTAVDSFIATTWTNPANASSGVHRQRPICMYPQRAMYNGNGSTDDAASWHCEVDELTRLTINPRDKGFLPPRA